MTLILRKIINGMKYLLAFDLFLLLCIHSSLAQHVEHQAKQDTVGAKARKDGEIELSDAFKKALDGAFSFGLKEAPLTKPNDLTIQQLHEWVGEPDWSDLTHQRHRPEKFDSTYKALKMWEREFYVPKPISNPEIQIPGLQLGKDDGPSAMQFDLQKLGRYLRPKEYRLYKVRKKAEKLLKEMDQ